MLLALTGRAALRAPIAAAPALAPMTTLPAGRGMTTLGRLDEKEKGEERIYFNKEDEKMLRKLAKKVREQALQVHTLAYPHRHGPRKPSIIRDLSWLYFYAKQLAGDRL